MITRLAKWWLKRRGCYVIKPGWIGLAVGYGYVIEHKEDRINRHFTVSIPAMGEICAFTNSIILTEKP